MECSTEGLDLIKYGVLFVSGLVVFVVCYFINVRTTSPLLKWVNFSGVLGSLFYLVFLIFNLHNLL